MRILIVGGGPGGLYAGLLLKQVNPGFDIRLVERNPANATYGWGVVFSDRTLNAFREADPPTFQGITDNFVIWYAIDTSYRDRLIRCDGHSFAGLSRRLMLNILQERCRELGVLLQFEQELTDFSSFKDYDLVVAADGVNSLIRTAHEEAFQPDLRAGKAKFIWFGTDKVLDSFTFIFRENQHGLFQVHAYPFDGTTSTFIVECEEAVWRKAGLDQADEADSIAYCQTLFAGFLDGHNLLSNRSLWTHFTTVKNRAWRHENIVLLGDAAHTAHFSIGSGTKIAMEDAIALAKAFQYTNDIDSALDLYEMDRRPRVSNLQQAAQQSQTYFEHIKRYLHLEPLQFTSHLLTRSGRINYDNLRVRDPYFVDKVDRWFSASDNSTAIMVAPPPMFTPLKLGAVTLTNRVVVSPTSTYAAVDGRLDSDQRERLTQVAQSGVALVMTEPVAVSAEGRITSGCAGLYDEGQEKVWKQIVKSVHQESTALIGVQLNHAGRRGATQPRQSGLDRPLKERAWPLLAPSPLAYSRYNQVPRQMKRKDMERVRDEYVRATGMAAKAGFDLLQVHCAQGYLLGSFVSPLTNQREDKYGGSLKNRLRFPLEVYDAVRQAWPEGKPLAATIQATDWAKDGLTVEDAVEVAKAFKDHGCDLIEVLAGGTIPNDQPTYGAGYLTDYCDQIRHEAGVATMVRGYLTTSGQVNSILAGGRADLCVMVKPDGDGG